MSDYKFEGTPELFKLALEREIVTGGSYWVMKKNSPVWGMYEFYDWQDNRFYIGDMDDMKFIEFHEIELIVGPILPPAIP